MESDFDREGNQEHEHGSKGSPRMAEKVLQEALLLIPNFLKLLYRLSKDPAVSTTDRALLAGTIGYVLLPWTFADMIPFLGQVDDVLLVALVVKRLMESVSHDVLEGYWDGDVRL